MRDNPVYYTCDTCAPGQHEWIRESVMLPIERDLQECPARMLFDASELVEELSDPSMDLARNAPWSALLGGTNTLSGLEGHVEHGALSGQVWDSGLV
jgi:hypothetical protein